MTFSTPESFAGSSVSSHSNESRQYKDVNNADFSNFKRLEKNKLAARRFRLKKKEELLNLRETASAQIEEIEKLVRSNRMIRQELNSAVRQIIEACMLPASGLNPAVASMASSFLVSQSSVDASTVKSMLDELQFKPPPHYLPPTLPFIAKPIPQPFYNNVFSPPLPYPIIEPTDSKTNPIPSGKFMNQSLPFHPYYNNPYFRSVEGASRYSSMNTFSIQ